jgi:hypothetical protein
MHPCRPARAARLHGPRPPWPRHTPAKRPVRRMTTFPGLRNFTICVRRAAQGARSARRRCCPPKWPGCGRRCHALPLASRETPGRLRGLDRPAAAAGGRPGGWRSSVLVPNSGDGAHLEERPQRRRGRAGRSRGLGAEIVLGGWQLAPKLLGRALGLWSSIRPMRRALHHRRASHQRPCPPAHTGMAYPPHPHAQRCRKKGARRRGAGAPASAPTSSAAVLQLGKAAARHGGRRGPQVSRRKGRGHGRSHAVPYHHRHRPSPSPPAIAIAVAIAIIWGKMTRALGPSLVGTPTMPGGSPRMQVGQMGVGRWRALPVPPAAGQGLSLIRRPRSPSTDSIADLGQPAGAPAPGPAARPDGRGQ